MHEHARSLSCQRLIYYGYYLLFIGFEESSKYSNTLSLFLFFFFQVTISSPLILYALIVTLHLQELYHLCENTTYLSAFIKRFRFISADNIFKLHTIQPEAK